MRIVSASSAFPQHYYSQEMLLAALQEYWGDQVENPHVLRRLHRHVGVDGRFLALPKEEYVKMRTWGEANHHWIRTAKELGEKAVAGALAGAGLHGRNLGAFFFASVTGIRWDCAAISAGCRFSVSVAWQALPRFRALPIMFALIRTRLPWCSRSNSAL